VGKGRVSKKEGLPDGENLVIIGSRHKGEDRTTLADRAVKKSAPGRKKRDLEFWRRDSGSEVVNSLQGHFKKGG